MFYCADFIGDRRSGINTSVADDVNTVFKGKTLAQLGLLGEQIRKKLKGGEGIDVGMYNVIYNLLKQTLFSAILLVFKKHLYLKCTALIYNYSALICMEILYNSPMH